jgi:hypothetical protein
VRTRAFFLILPSRVFQISRHYRRRLPCKKGDGGRRARQPADLGHSRSGALSIDGALRCTLLNVQPCLPRPIVCEQVRIYYRGAAAAILVFDMTDKTSFLKLKDWVAELQTVLGNDLLIAVACNKCDLSSRREVSMEQAQDFANSLGATLFETSAKSNQGVEELFLDLSAKLLQRAEGECIIPSALSPLPSTPPPPPPPSHLIPPTCSCRQAGSSACRCFRAAGSA